MAKIKAKNTGDVFEAPAADFATEADFEIVDDATPVTTDVVPNVSTDGAASDTALSATSGTTESSTGTLSPTSTDPLETPVATSDAASTPETSESTAQDSAAPLADGGVTAPVEPGNYDAAADTSPNATAAVVADSGQPASSVSADATAAPAPDAGTDQKVTYDAQNPSADLGNVGTASVDSGQIAPSAEAQIVGDTADVETKTYPDGATATGTAPLPEESPISGNGVGSTLSNNAEQTSSDALPSQDAISETTTDRDPASSTLSSDSTNGTAASLSDSQNADAATPLDPTIPPVTDSVHGSPTGGPSAGRGNSLDAKSKHIVADQLESDTLYAVGQIIDVGDDLKHAADAFFDQVRSAIDVQNADAR